MAARCANAYDDNCLESRCCDDPLHQCMKRETREYAQCRKVKTAFCERQGEWLCPEMWCPGCWPQPPLSSPLPSPPPSPSPPPPPPSPRPPPPPWHDPFFDLQDRPPSPPPRTAPRPSSLLARPFALPPPPPPLDERYDGEAQSVDQLRADLRALRGLRPLEGLAIAILALLVLGAVAALVLARLPRRAARRGSPEESAELARA